MLGWLKDFHRKTMEKYQEGMEMEMEPWKKRVMQIHQEAAFLFYVDDMENYTPGTSDGVCLVRGELVKGKRQEGDPILLLDGEGKLLAKALIQTDVEEKEDRRKGLLKRKRNEFKMELTELYDRKAEGLDEAGFRRYLWKLYLD
ncbi:MAG: hypothetical protein IJH60_00070, partial [Eubacterium sp.]|nr:hypothetical protein [Eubacterium sp.]